MCWSTGWYLTEATGARTGINKRFATAGWGTRCSLTAHLIYFTNSSWKTKYEVQTAKTGYACASVYYPRQHSKEWHEQPLLRAHTFMTVPYVVYELTAWECAWDRRRPGRLLMFRHGWLFSTTVFIRRIMRCRNHIRHKLQRLSNTAECLIYVKFGVRLN